MATVTRINVGDDEYDVQLMPNSLGIVDYVYRNNELLFVELYEPKIGVQFTQFVRPTHVGTSGFSADTVEYESTDLPLYRDSLTSGHLYWEQETTFTFEPSYIERQIPTTNNYVALNNPNFKIYKTTCDVGIILESQEKEIYEYYLTNVLVESQEYNTDYSDDNTTILSDRTLEGYAGEYGITALVNSDLDAAQAPLHQADVTIQMPLGRYIVSTDSDVTIGG